jgi:hypothetical protein
MKDTQQLRNKLLKLWAAFDNGDIDSAEARTHIGFARATLDTLKVEIAASHLSAAQIPPVSLEGQESVVNVKSRRLAA